MLILYTVIYVTLTYFLGRGLQTSKENKLVLFLLLAFLIATWGGFVVYLIVFFSSDVIAAVSGLLLGALTSSAGIAFQELKDKNPSK